LVEENCVARQNATPEEAPEVLSQPDVFVPRSAHCWARGLRTSRVQSPRVWNLVIRQHDDASFTARVRVGVRGLPLLRAAPAVRKLRLARWRGQILRPCETLSFYFCRRACLFTSDEAWHTTAHVMKRYNVVHAATATDFARASVLSDFAFAWEEREAPLTEFRAVWTDQCLGFRFDCVDDDLVLDESADSRERVTGSDRVEIFFAPSLALDPYFCLEMCPRGELIAFKARTYRQFEWDWQCEGLSVSAHITKAGYSVEGTIPLATLRTLGVLAPGAQEFIAGVYRADFSRAAQGTVHRGWLPWVNPRTATPDFHVPASFGVFELRGG
jgi:hypothetical protein